MDPSYTQIEYLLLLPLLFPQPVQFIRPVMALLCSPSLCLVYDELSKLPSV